MTEFNSKWKYIKLAIHRSSRSSAYAELCHFTLLFCRGRQSNVKQITDTRVACRKETFDLWRPRFRRCRGLLKLPIGPFVLSQD